MTQEEVAALTDFSKIIPSMKTAAGACRRLAETTKRTSEAMGRFWEAVRLVKDWPPA
jgi:hypothetical protein